jgi:hypothetical protein
MSSVIGRWGVAIAAAVTVGAVAGPARATAIAYDGFAYPPGPVPGNAGGTGFGGPWAGDVGVTVQGAASLTHPLALPSTGVLIGGNFNIDRPLPAAISQSVFWASFLIQAAPGNDQVWMGIDPGVTQFPFVTFGRRLGNYFLQNASNAPVNFCCASGAGVTDLLIIRVTSSGAGSKVDLWVNKNPSVSPPDLTMPIPPPPPFQIVNVQVQNGFFADEIRLGTSAQDVAAGASSPAVPIPPGAVATLGALLLLAGFAVLRRRADRGWRNPHQ